MRLYIPQRHNLNQELLVSNFEIVNSMKECDVAIVQSTLPNHFEGEYSKIIYVAVEPPLADHRLFCYSHFDDFSLVVTHNPNPDKLNQIPFTETDEPQYYPTNPNPSIISNYTYEDLDRQPRGIFYAGMIGPYEEQPDAYGGINLTVVRRELGDFIFNNFPGSKIIGIGRNGQTEKVSDWRLDKSNQIRDSDCDFVLALENTMLPNYLYEKIWDGFASDKVVLYLGDPLIDKHIPLDCFIDLRQWFNKDTKEFDYVGFKDFMDNFTTEQYNQMRKKARIFRETANGRHQELQDRLTNRIIKYIKNYIKV